MFIKANGHGYVNTDHIRWFEYRMGQNGQTEIIANIGDESVRIETCPNREAAEDRLRSIVDQIDEE